MNEAFEQWAAKSFLRPSSFAVAIGSGNGAWAAMARGFHPTASVLEAEAPELAVQYDAHRVRHVQLLRLTGAVALDALQAVAPLLRYARIDAISLTDVPPEIRSRLEQLPALDEYTFIRPKGLAGDSASAAFVVLHRRLLALFGGQKKEMLDLPALCHAHALAPRGVIHVGANDGAEYEVYAGMGLARMLFVEANPAVFARLQARVGDKPGVSLANCAIVDRPGPVSLRLASRDESSSVLPLGEVHRQNYPGIVEAGVVEVPGKTLDGLLSERALAPEGGTLLNIDVQGAELMVLHGAVETLPHIAAINVEVNFGELYQGCAQIEEIEDFLAARGFRRVALVSPYDPAWGDAFYVREPG